jgi:hypothetical protein
VRYEASLESTAQASRTDLGLSLGGSLGTVGVGAGAGSTAEDEQRALYRAINTPFSVARITDNTLQVRLGAVFAGTKTGYVTPAQQYFLTALVLLRRTSLQEASRADSYLLDLLPCPAVFYVAETSIRDVKKGAELSREDPKAVLKAKLAALLPTHRAETEQLAEAVLSGDYREFVRALGDKNDVWADAVEVSSSMGRSVGSFTVPDRYFKFFSTAAKAAVVDDGKAATLTISDSLANVTAAGIIATLKLQDIKSKEELFYTVHPKSVTVDSSGRTAIVTFPSASSVCPPEKEKDPSPCRVTEASLRWGRPLSRWYNPTGVAYWDWTCPDPSPDPDMRTRGMKTRAECLSVSIAKPPSPPPAASISMPGGRVVLTPPDGGSFAVILRLPSQPAKGTETPKKIPAALTFEGADATTVTGAHLYLRDTFWLVDGDTVLMVSVKNAVVGGTIRVKATSLDEKQKPLDDPKATVFQDIIVIAPPPAQPPAKNKN